MISVRGTRVNPGEAFAWSRHRSQGTCGSPPRTPSSEPTPPASGWGVGRSCFLPLEVALAAMLERASADQPDQWLFAGLKVGEPTHPGYLAARLREVGVPIRAGRSSALAALAYRIPAPVLADLLGMSAKSTAKARPPQRDPLSPDSSPPESATLRSHSNASPAGIPWRGETVRGKRALGGPERSG